MPYRSWHGVHRLSMATQAISHTCAHTHIGIHRYTHVHTHRHMSCSLAHDTPSAWNSLSHLVLWKASWRLSFHGLFSRHLPWFLPSLPGSSPIFWVLKTTLYAHPRDCPASCHNYPPAQVASPPDYKLLENQGSVLCVLVFPSRGMVLSPLQMVVKWLNGWIPCFWVEMLGSSPRFYYITWHVLSEILITLTLVTQPGDFHPN